MESLRFEIFELQPIAVAQLDQPLAGAEAVAQLDQPLAGAEVVR